jgi:DNA replication ATP-dependent helicase Dna2
VITHSSTYGITLTSLQPRPGNWHRNQNRTTLGDTTNVTAAPKPPVPATSQAKSKLKAFQFVAGQPNATRESTGGKENGSVADSSRPVDSIVKLHGAASSSAPHNPTKTASTMNEADSIKTPQLCHANTFPSTPGARLSLEDLIGNVDDNKNPEPREESPEEHIGWIPNSSSTQLTPNRKRKRARSSSPSCPNTSSQRAEASAFFAGGAEQQTPEADPAADLWQRYGISKGSGDALRQPDLNSLAFGGSPRPLETPVKGSGLRRWASTGNDWPSSKSKKRRSNANMKVDVWQNGTAGSGGRSKVAAMVEKIQESLATQKLAKSALAPSGDEPPSSDPLPDTASKITKPQHVASPLEAEPSANIPQSNLNRRMAPPSARPQVGTRVQTLAVDDPDNNKDDTTRNVNAFSGQENVAPAPLHLQSKAPLPAFRRPSIRRAPSDNTPRPMSMPAPSVAPVHPHLPVLAEDLDEFGDDMDFSTEDLDELLSQPLQKRSLHDIPAHPNPPAQQQQQPQQPQQQPRQQLTAQQSIANELIDLADDDFDDDEFACDDLDETSFIQAELQATQAYRASRPSSK